ncbi:partial phosphopentomutase, partial [Gammaproteobacteria bacterium]
MRRRAILIVLDGVGAGAARDASGYGDADSHTLAHVADAVGGVRLPALERLGLGKAVPMRGMRSDLPAFGAWGTMHPASPGKDSTTGHWELAGLHLQRPFPTYPRGFPPDVVTAFSRATGRAVIGNVAGSGTDLIERFAGEHLATGAWIVYTSADSVFQVAAHEDVVPLAELYTACESARRLLVSPHNVSRVIARPFVGEPGSWRRTPNRRDFSLEPLGETLLDALTTAGIPRAGVGKVDDLFAGRGISSHHTADNQEGLERISAWLRGEGNPDVS